MPLAAPSSVAGGPARDRSRAGLRRAPQRSGRPFAGFASARVARAEIIPGPWGSPKRREGTCRAPHARPGCCLHGARSSETIRARSAEQAPRAIHTNTSVATDRDGGAPSPLRTRRDPVWQTKQTRQQERPAAIPRLQLPREVVSKPVSPRDNRRRWPSWDASWSPRLATQKRRSALPAPPPRRTRRTHTPDLADANNDP